MPAVLNLLDKLAENEDAAELKTGAETEGACWTVSVPSTHDRVRLLVLAKEGAPDPKHESAKVYARGS